MPLRRGRRVHGRSRRRRGRPGHGNGRSGDGRLLALSLAVVATTTAALRVARGRGASERVDVVVGILKELIIAERCETGRAGSGLWRGEQIDGSRATKRRTSSTAIACASGRLGARVLPSRSSRGGASASASAPARAWSTLLALSFLSRGVSRTIVTISRCSLAAPQLSSSTSIGSPSETTRLFVWIEKV
jgi:hypothetical protein